MHYSKWLPGRAKMKIGTKTWNESLPDVITEVLGLIGMLALTGLMALGFVVVHALHPR
jgi:hypothetical protein